MVRLGNFSLSGPRVRQGFMTITLQFGNVIGKEPDELGSSSRTRISAISRTKVVQTRNKRPIPAKKRREIKFEMRRSQRAAICKDRAVRDATLITVQLV
jgi:hypothetical protein